MFLRSLIKLKESFLSTLPVVVVVLLLYFIPGMGIELSINQIVVFSISAALVVIGMWLFNLGAEVSMKKMGELVGSSLTKRQSMVLLIIILFLFGLFITLAEPDLSVLASQVPSIPRFLLIMMIGIGVGVFVVIGALRILFQKSLKVWLLGFYGLMFGLCLLIDKSYIPLSLDSGGVTTGPITVPFILAVGVGIATSRAGNKSNNDSFGLVAFSSIGPILMVLILALVFRNNLSYTFEETLLVKDPNTGIWDAFVYAMLPRGSEYGSILSVTISLSPLILCFIVYELIFIKLSGKMVLNIVLGVVVAYLGLVFFMTAVNAGFLPIGQKLGLELATGELWLLVLVAAFLGIAAVFAEPAVHVLTHQMEDITEGAINRITVLIVLALGNGIAIVLSVLRIYYGVEFNLLYIVVPGYILAFALSFAVPDIYTAMAFDSGGVVSGPMNTTFILPFAIGACHVMLGDEYIMSNAFGTIALVALMPLIMIQLIGLSASIKIRAQYRIARNRIREEFDDQIIHFE